MVTARTSHTLCSFGQDGRLLQRFRLCPCPRIWGPLLNRRMTKKAVIIAVMRKLAHLIHVVVKSRQPSSSDYHHLGLAIQDSI